VTQKLKSASIERIALEMTSSLNLQEVLATITQGLVDELEAAFARIWLLRNGDLCTECHKADQCVDRELCLHLKASAGIYENLNGEFRRYPYGAPIIGRIIHSEEPLFTNDLLKEGHFQDKRWIRDNGFQSYVGHPLVFRGEQLGVLVMFCCRVMSQKEFERVASFANQAAIAIKNAQLFEEVKQLKDRLQAECVYLQQEIKHDHDFEEIIGQSEIFKDELRKAQQVAPTDATVLILGETGTGKELIARQIHSTSPRAERPLVKVDCSSLSPALIESELFGHEKGAFTGAHSRKTGRFELADGGTIFLDEIGNLPLELQAKLLRVLQEGKFERVGGIQTIRVDVRIIAATNRDLEKAITAGEFREDLYYRLNVFPIRMPALREHKEDIPHLARHFAKKYSVKFGKNIDVIPEIMMKSLQAYSWPGNVRELENIIERAIIISQNRTLELNGFRDFSGPENSNTHTPQTLLEVERAYILRVLENSNWVIEGRHGAATRLDLNPGTLRFRMKKLGIKRP